MIRLLLLSIFLAIVAAYDWVQPNLGRACKAGENGTAPGIKYYHDRQTFENFPFFYRGCGGDYNRYDSRERAPVVMDAAHCSGYPVYVGDCHRGDDIIRPPIRPGGFPGTPAPPKACPPTAYCLISSPWGGHGKCCDSGAAERAGKNREAPECLISVQPAVRETTWKGEENLLGRNCSHDFCPQGSICHQGEFYAYCCWRPLHG